MSTMSTQLNLGASYLVNDFYIRFFKKGATEKEKIWAARAFTILSAFLGLGLGLLLNDAKQAFDLMLLLGAGTGLIYILRWFWWRINATTEIVAMIVSLIVASLFTFIDHDLLPWQTIVYGAGLTTVLWIIATFITPPDDDETLRNFYQRIKPGGPGWNKVLQKAKDEGVPLQPVQDKPASSNIMYAYRLYDGLCLIIFNREYYLWTCYSGIGFCGYFSDRRFFLVQSMEKVDLELKGDFISKDYSKLLIDLFHT